MSGASRPVVLAAAWILGMLTSGACAKDGAGESVVSDTSARRDSATTTSGSAVPAAGTDGISVATGVFTAVQATRGHEVYSASCGQCHTMAQHSGGAFAAAWNGRRLSDLYEIVRNTMPLDNPGGLTDQEYVDVIAYMLELNGVPAGKTPLPADAAALRGLRIEVKPSAGP